MSSGISNRSRWLLRFIPNVLSSFDLLLLNQRSEHPARRDHSSPQNCRYAAPGMHRSPDPPQPRTSTIVVRGPVQGSAPPERTRGPVERSSYAPPGAEVSRVEDLVLPEIAGRRSLQSGREGDAFDLPPDERILQIVCQPVRRRRKQYGQRPSGVRVDLTPAIVIDKRHRLPRLSTGLEALVERTGVGRQHDAVHPHPGRQLLLKRRVHGNPGAGHLLPRTLLFGV